MRISAPLVRSQSAPAAQSEVLRSPTAAMRPATSAALARHGWLAVPLLGALASRAWSILLLGAAARADHLPLIGQHGILDGWDAQWYLGIAANGYHEAPLRLNPLGGQHDFAFFPLWPLLLRGFAAIGIPAADIAPILSAGLFCLGAVLVALALEPAFGRLVATDATFLLAFSPAGWIFSMGYSESLFLVFAALAFVLRRPGPRALAVAAAVLSRVAGLPLVAVDGLRFVRSRGRDLGALAVAVVGGLAFAGWWIAVAVISKDPLGFLHGTPDWVKVSGTALVAHVIETADPRLLGQLSIYAVVALGALIAWRRSWPLGTYAGLSLALGLLPGGLVSSMPRYALAAFPAFAGLASVGGRRGAAILLGVFAIAQVALVAASFAPSHRLAP